MGKTGNYICSLLSHYVWTIPLVKYVVSYFKNIWKSVVYLISFARLQRKEMILQCSILCQTTVCNAPSSSTCGYNFMFQAWNKIWVRHDVAGEEVVTALGSEVIRLEKQIRELVPGIQHVDIEAHNPMDQSLWSEKKKVALLQGLSSYG